MARTKRESPHLKTKLKMFDIEAWKVMDSVRHTDPKEFVRIRNTLVEQNRPYAVAVAASFHRRYARDLDLQDMIQAACVGLTIAVERFNPGKGSYKLEDFDPAKGGFTAYASNFVLAQLRSLAKTSRVVHKPERIDARSDLKKAYREFVAKHDRDPTPEEFPLPPKISLARVKAAAEPQPPIHQLDVILGSIEHPEHSPEKRTHRIEVSGVLAASPETPESFMLRQENERFEAEALEVLTEDERFVVTKMIMEERRVRETGSAMSPKRNVLEVRQLLASGLAKLKAYHGV